MLSPLHQQADAVLPGDPREVLPPVQRHEDGPRPPRTPLCDWPAQRQRPGLRRVCHLPRRAGTVTHSLVMVNSGHLRPRCDVTPRHLVICTVCCVNVFTLMSFGFSRTIFYFDIVHVQMLTGHDFWATPLAWWKHLEIGQINGQPFYSNRVV